MVQPDPSQPQNHPPGSFSVPGTCEHIGRIRAAVIELANRIGFSADDLAAIELAVGEAVENIVEHAYAKPHQEWQSQRDPEIRLHIHVNNSRLIIELHDHGQGFDFASYQPPPSHESIRSGRTSGYGIFIMREFMDEVQYSSSAEAGNTLRLVKYLKKS
jgi:serine/threonine-protein kinase RsbW